jgi:hypothetical protein
MANENHMGDGRAVPIDLPPAQIAILRDDLTTCLEGVRLDLRTPQRMNNPDWAQREAEVYDRLLAALDRGTIFVPDESARATIEAVAKGDDDASNYAEIAAHHDALYGLLGLLGGAKV